MGPRVTTFAVVAGIVFFVFVLRAVRSGSIKPMFTLLWIGIASFLLSVPVLESFYKWLSVTVIGIEDARHIIYISLIGFLLLYTCYMTVMVSQLSDRLQEIISHLAILENTIQSRTRDG